MVEERNRGPVERAVNNAIVIYYNGLNHFDSINIVRLMFTKNF